MSESLAAVAGIDASYTEVMVLSTARRHGRGPQRLPDRADRGRPVAAVQVETDEQAARVLAALDLNGRNLFIDVERKQDLRLMAVARATVSQATVHAIKPNDITVDALVAVLENRFGPDLSDTKILVNGTGNLGFKFALRLAETGCDVHLSGRDSAKVGNLVAAINAVLPAHTPHFVKDSAPIGVQVLVSAVTAEHVITEATVERLAAEALCLDVGINNFAPGFIEAANAAGHVCSRLDVRSAGDPLPVVPNPFFEDVAGRRVVGSSEIVAGGLLGRLGDLVVDQVRRPTRVIGVANGTGGLLAPEAWTAAMASEVADVEARIAKQETD